MLLFIEGYPYSLNDVVKNNLTVRDIQSTNNLWFEINAKIVNNILFSVKKSREVMCHSNIFLNFAYIKINMLW